MTNVKAKLRTSLPPGGFRSLLALPPSARDVMGVRKLMNLPSTKQFLMGICNLEYCFYHYSYFFLLVLYVRVGLELVTILEHGNEHGLWTVSLETVLHR